MTLGITNCYLCIGLHPDQVFNKAEIKNRLINPQKNAFSKFQQFERKRKLYANKSCMLCGRTYNENGIEDESFNLTARRVHLELENAGIMGVPPEKVKLIVASCRKAFTYLLKNKDKMSLAEMDRFTFTGRLTLIITHAQESRNNTITKGLMK